MQSIPTWAERIKSMIRMPIPAIIIKSNRNLLQWEVHLKSTRNQVLEFFSSNFTDCFLTKLNLECNFISIDNFLILNCYCLCNWIFKWALNLILTRAFKLTLHCLSGIQNNLHILYDTCITKWSNIARLKRPTRRIQFFAGWALFII